MNKYQDLIQVYPAIEGIWNRLTDAVMNSDPSLPEFIGTYIDALGGMKACFKSGAVDAMSLRFLSLSTFNNIQSDETMIDTSWAGEIMRACSGVLGIIPQGPINEADYKDLTPPQRAVALEQVRSSAPTYPPVSDAGRIDMVKPQSPAATPPAPSVVLPVRASTSLPEIVVREDTSAPVPMLSVQPAAGGFPNDPVLEPALTSAAARAFGFASTKPVVAPAGIAAPTLSEFGEDMPLPKVQVALPAPVAVVAVVEEVAPRTQPLPAETSIAAPCPVAIIPEALPPSTPEVASDVSRSSAEDPDLQTIETELEQVFELPQPGPANDLDHVEEEQEPAPLAVAEVTDAVAQQPTVAELPASPAAFAAVQAEPASPAVPEFVSASQPDPAPVTSLFADPSVFERATQLFQECRDSVSGYVPRGAVHNEFAGLPDDLRPDNPALASIFMNSGPIVIAPRFPGAPVAQEIMELKRRTTAAFEQPLYQSRPFLDHWLLTNYCVERMLSECFTPSGDVKDVKEAASFAVVLGRIALYSEYFMATPFGMDLFETAMRAAHSLDPAKACVSPNHMPAVRKMRDRIDGTIREIAKTSAGPNMMPPIYPYVVDWLAKMMMSITEDAKTTDFDTLRDFSVGLSMVIIRAFGLGSKEVDSQVVSVSNYFNHLVNKAFWC